MVTNTAPKFICEFAMFSLETLAVSIFLIADHKQGFQTQECVTQTWIPVFDLKRITNRDSWVRWGPSILLLSLKEDLASG